MHAESERIILISLEARRHVNMADHKMGLVLL